MTYMRTIRTTAALALVATATLVAACSSSSKSGGGNGGGGGSSGGNGGGSSNGGAPVTLTWWHNANQDPGRKTWQQIADAYHAAHPNVTFKIQPIQNEQLKAKVPLALQGSNPPSLYNQWGGGALITQVQSGKVMDITQAVSSWVDGQIGNAAKGWQLDGKQYGIPYDLHVVGFWYRKDLFQQAGITTPPTTMDELNSDVTKLKAAGIAPIAVGSKDQWPDAFWYDYFVLRECPQNTVQDGIKNQKFDDQCFVKAGQDLKAFLDTKPFQPSFLATSAQQGAGSSAGLVANGKAAMELQGDWELPTMIPLTHDKNYASKLSWFPFPAVSGGQGDQRAALGGGDGFSCTTKATDACPDFLKYISSTEVQTKLVQTTTATLPSNPAAVSAITDPTLKLAENYLKDTQYNQLYFDQALTTDVGLALNKAIADFFAGKGSPEDIAGSVAKAAAQQ
jgi:raffinose/stachyose/melibiose transport system substrate-binding protein